MNRQHGGIGMYLVFSVVISIGAGYGVYRWMHDNKSMWQKSDDAATTRTAPAGSKKPANAAVTVPVPAPEPAVAVPDEADPIAEESPAVLAASRARDAIVDAESDGSPVFGTPGIAGGIEAGSVGRRFRPRAEMLQRCFERNGGGESGSVRVTLMVEPTGKITQIRVDDRWGEGFAACVMTALNGVTFSATSDRESAVVVQPIAFR
ncbi:MAG TPA: hypothetical protein VMZ53_20245 [Kofleriaceae bacterium]|nr:hypothetical protein [Kofleriaceae bacterium]